MASLETIEEGASARDSPACGEKSFVALRDEQSLAVYSLHFIPLWAQRRLSSHDSCVIF